MTLPLTTQASGDVETHRLQDLIGVIVASLFGRIISTSILSDNKLIQSKLYRVAGRSKISLMLYVVGGCHLIHVSCININHNAALPRTRTKEYRIRNLTTII
jgi:hypothetical protein